ncbi:MAG TPA: TonB family protein [Candidatus Sulfotelmatobacter sp.]
MPEGRLLNLNGPAQRRTPRYEVHMPLDVMVLRSGIPDRVPGRSLNLSERGVGVVLAAELMAGEAVGLEMQLPDRAQPLRWRAIVRHQDKLHCGMEFAGLSEEEKSAIRYCTEKMRAKRESAADAKPPLEIAARPEDPKKAEIREQAESQEKKKDRKKEPKPPAREKDRDREVDGNKESDTSQASINKGGEGHDSAPPDNTTGQASARPVRLWQLLVVTCAILLSVFWWRWNRGWEELESGLSLQQEAAAVSPQVQVAAEEMEKLLIHRVDPEYPAEARRARLESVIALDVIVGKDGSVVSVHPLNGPEVLTRPATDAMRWWKFEPYQVNGKPVTVETTLAVEFKP